MVGQNCLCGHRLLFFSLPCFPCFLRCFLSVPKKLWKTTPIFIASYLRCTRNMYYGHVAGDCHPQKPFHFPREKGYLLCVLSQQKQKKSAAESMSLVTPTPSKNSSKTPAASGMATASNGGSGGVLAFVLFGVQRFSKKSKLRDTFSLIPPCFGTSMNMQDIAMLAMGTVFLILAVLTIKADFEDW